MDVDSSAAQHPILLVEDDDRLGRNIKLNLELRGYHVQLAADLQNAQASFQANFFRACLLDVELPDGNGVELCDWIRTYDKQISILMISARHEESTAVRALELGADDYIRKPFGMKELAIRIEKLLNKYRRQEERQSLGMLSLNHDLKLAYYSDKDLKLARREFELLKIFMNYPARVFSRTQLADALSYDDIIQDRTIDSHLSHLRKKLKESGCKDILLTSVYGSGYRLDYREGM